MASGEAFDGVGWVSDEFTYTKTTPHSLYVHHERKKKKEGGGRIFGSARRPSFRLLESSRGKGGRKKES